MNPAIEYMVRSGTARDAFEAPCSLFLSHLTQFNKRLVVTIKWHEFSGKYLVKQWKLHEAEVQDMLPPFVEVALTHDQLFADKTTIVPMFDLLPFKEHPYKSGVWQRSDGDRAVHQAEEYQQTIDNFLNPPQHERLRVCWLWASFVRSHRVRMEEASIYRLADEQMWVAQTQYKAVWQKWLLWRKHLHFTNPVAPELVFLAAYRDKVTAEKAKLPKSEWSNGAFNEDSSVVTGIPKKAQYANWGRQPAATTAYSLSPAYKATSYSHWAANSPSGGYYMLTSANSTATTSDANGSLWVIE